MREIIRINIRVHRFWGALELLQFLNGRTVSGPENKKTETTKHVKFSRFLAKCKMRRDLLLRQMCNYYNFKGGGVAMQRKAERSQANANYSTIICVMYHWSQEI